MKLLKQGTISTPKPKPWVGMTVTCDNCKSEMEIEETDDVDPFTDRTIDDGHLKETHGFKINCCVCGSQIVKVLL